MIAIAHDLAVILHRTLKSGTPYREAGQPAPDERKRQRLIRHYVRRLGKLGIAVHSLRPESATHTTPRPEPEPTMSITRNEPSHARKTQLVRTNPTSR